MSSFNPPEPYVWTCLNHWVIPDMISTAVSPLFRHLVKMIILSFPRETFDLDFCLLTLEAKNIYRNNLPWPFCTSRQEPVESHRRLVHRRTVACHARRICTAKLLLLSWEPVNLEMLNICYICYPQNTHMAMPCNGNVEQRSPANYWLRHYWPDWRHIEHRHTPCEMDCTACFAFQNLKPTVPQNFASKWYFSNAKCNELRARTNSVCRAVFEYRPPSKAPWRS